MKRVFAISRRRRERQPFIRVLKAEGVFARTNETRFLASPKYEYSPMHTTEYLNKAFPRLRDPAFGRGGEFTQPRKNLFWVTLYKKYEYLALLEYFDEC